jgi:hypothetical protein
VPLPIAREIDARLPRHRQPRNARHLLAIGDPAAILAPRGFLGVAEEVGAGNVMVVADLTPAKAAEIFLRPIRACTVQAVRRLAF